MPFYLKKGSVPDKRHIQHRDKNGNLYQEELISREGFSDIYSNAARNNNIIPFSKFHFTKL